jgi:hypothetical protein
MEISVQVSGKFADIDDQFNKGYPKVEINFHPGPVEQYSYVPVEIILKSEADVDRAVEILKGINFKKIKLQPSIVQIRKWFDGFHVVFPCMSDFQ